MKIVFILGLAFLALLLAGFVFLGLTASPVQTKDVVKVIPNEKIFQD